MTHSFQSCLLSEPVLTLQTAMQIVLIMESATQNAKTLQVDAEGSASTSGEVLEFTGAKPGRSKQQMLLCIRCGKPSHLPWKCRLKDARCQHCHKLGRIKPACLELKKVQTKL